MPRKVPEDLGATMGPNVSVVDGLPLSTKKDLPQPCIWLGESPLRAVAFAAFTLTSLGPLHVKTND